MTVNKGGAAPACAACKYQRRKCTPDCTLAPYFPASDSGTFQNVHRLFGVSKVTKTLDSLTREDHKHDAIKSMIYEAEIRRRFPVLGCKHVINKLMQDTWCAVAELQHVYAQLEYYKNNSRGVGDDGMIHTQMITQLSSDVMGMNIDHSNDPRMMRMMPTTSENDNFKAYDAAQLDHEAIQILLDADACLSSTNLEEEGAVGSQTAQAELKTAAAAFSLTTVK